MPMALMTLTERLTGKEHESSCQLDGPSHTPSNVGAGDAEEIALPDNDMREAGMATAEYAIATVAACGFAALLVVILKSDAVRSTLLSIVQHALSLGG